MARPPRPLAGPRPAAALAALAPLLALGALAAGCGTDPAPPPPPPEPAISAQPTASWLCPGAQGPAFRVLARSLPDRPVPELGDDGAPVVDAEGRPVYQATRRVVVSIDAQATDQRTGNAFGLAPSGRCAEGGGPCGHLDVLVTDAAGAEVAPRQRFGSARFELTVGEAPGARAVRLELRDDREEPFLDAAGAPVAFDVSLDVVIAAAGEAPGDACDPDAAPEGEAAAGE